jgi:hypothetical protein
VEGDVKAVGLLNSDVLCELIRLMFLMRFVFFEFLGFPLFVEGFALV